MGQPSSDSRKHFRVEGTHRCRGNVLFRSAVRTVQPAVVAAIASREVHKLFDFDVDFFSSVCVWGAPEDTACASSDRDSTSRLVLWPDDIAPCSPPPVRGSW